MTDILTSPADGGGGQQPQQQPAQDPSNNTPGGGMAMEKTAALATGAGQYPSKPMVTQQSHQPNLATAAAPAYVSGAATVPAGAAGTPSPATAPPLPTGAQPSATPAVATPSLPGVADADAAPVTSGISATTTTTATTVEATTSDAGNEKAALVGPLTATAANATKAAHANNAPAAAAGAATADSTSSGQNGQLHSPQNPVVDNTTTMMNSTALAGSEATTANAMPGGAVPAVSTAAAQQPNVADTSVLAGSSATGGATGGQGVMTQQHQAQAQSGTGQSAQVSQQHQLGVREAQVNGMPSSVLPHNSVAGLAVGASAGDVAGAAGLKASGGAVTSVIGPGGAAVATPPVPDAPPGVLPHQQAQGSQQIGQSQGGTSASVGLGGSGSGNTGTGGNVTDMNAIGPQQQQRDGGNSKPHSLPENAASASTMMEVDSAQPKAATASTSGAGVGDANAVQGAPAAAGLGASAVVPSGSPQVGAASASAGSGANGPVTSVALAGQQHLSPANTQTNPEQVLVGGGGSGAVHAVSSSSSQSLQTTSSGATTATTSVLAPSTATTSSIAAATISAPATLSTTQSAPVSHPAAASANINSAPQEQPQQQQGQQQQQQQHQQQQQGGQGQVHAQILPGNGNNTPAAAAHQVSVTSGNTLATTTTTPTTTISSAAGRAGVNQSQQPSVQGQNQQANLQQLPTQNQPPPHSSMTGAPALVPATAATPAGTSAKAAAAGGATAPNLTQLKVKEEQKALANAHRMATTSLNPRRIAVLNRAHKKRMSMSTAGEPKAMQILLLVMDFADVQQLTTLSVLCRGANQFARNHPYWRMYALSLVRTLHGHVAPINMLTSAGQFVFSGSSDGKIKAWDTRTWTCENTLNVNPFPDKNKQSAAAAAAAASSAAALASGPSAVARAQAAAAQAASSSSSSSKGKKGSKKGSKRETKAAKAGAVAAAAAAAAAAAVVTPAHPGSGEKGERVMPVTALAVLDRLLYMGLDDGRLVARVIFGQRPHSGDVEVRAHGGAIRAIALSKTRVFTAAADGVVKAFAQKSFKVDGELVKHSDIVTSLVIIGNRLFCGSHDMRISVWNINSLKFECYLGDRLKENHTGRVTCMCTHDGKLYSSGWDCCIKIWDGKTLQLINSVSISPIGVCRSMTVRLPPNKRGSSSQAAVAAAEAGTRGVSAANATSLVCGVRDSDIEIRDLSDINLPVVSSMRKNKWAPQRLEHKNWVGAILCLDDGRIITGSADWSVKVWYYRGAPPPQRPPSTSHQAQYHHQQRQPQPPQQQVPPGHHPHAPPSQRPQLTPQQQAIQRANLQRIVAAAQRAGVPLLPGHRQYTQQQLIAFQQQHRQQQQAFLQQQQQQQQQQAAAAAAAVAAAANASNAAPAAAKPKKRKARPKGG